MSKEDLTKSDLTTVKEKEATDPTEKVGLKEWPTKSYQPQKMVTEKLGSKVEDISYSNKNRDIEDLFSAIVQGNSDNAKDIVSKMSKENLTKTSSSGELPISKAAKKEQVDVVNEIINKSPTSTISQDSKGETLLHNASNSERLTRQAILQGGDTNKVDKSGKKPQDHANDPKIAEIIASKSSLPKSWVEIIKDRESEGNNNERTC